MTAISDLLGRASWMYDTRGRVVTETKFITNAGTYTTGFGYDGLDRVITTTYPTGEVITHTYNAQGLLENVRSQTHNQWYASNLDYNALGQVKRIDLGNTVVITYAYYGDSNHVMQVQISGTQIITTACAGVTRLHIRQDRL